MIMTINIATTIIATSMIILMAMITRMTIHMITAMSTIIPMVMIMHTVARGISSNRFVPWRPVCCWAVSL